MPRKKHQYHYIYKTTCLITNKYYYGMHSTSNLGDDYMGSGKRLRYSIRKHGEDNHTKEIIEFLKNREELAEREKQIVNEELIQDKLCMNLMVGGKGGFTKEQCLKGTLRMNSIIWNDEEFIKAHKKRKSEMCKQLHKDGIIHAPDQTGYIHTTEAKKKIGLGNSIKQKGEFNSQYGKCWITNDKESKKIYKGDLIPTGWRLGRKMRV